MMDEQDNDGATKDLIATITRLKQDRDAIILAHNYQRPETQDIADYCGDSLELSIIASKAHETVIVFCGVRFMAETASILCPKKTVLLPVLDAGCPLADTATADGVRQMKKKYPDAVVVSYVNTSADVKAQSDICCTSANAVEVVGSVDAKRPVIFVSDRNLGHYAGRMAQREIILWDGTCPSHDALSVSDIKHARGRYPGAKVMVHPECKPEVLESVDLVAGTAGMLAYVLKQAPGTSYIVGTEIGMIHRLERDNPDKTFYPAADYLVCPTMKLTTLEDVRRALEKMEYVVTVEGEVRVKAQAALDAMLAISRLSANS